MPPDRAPDTGLPSEKACGRLLVGQGDDTYDPTCVLPAGHKGVCAPEGRYCRYDPKTGIHSYHVPPDQITTEGCASPRHPGEKLEVTDLAPDRIRGDGGLGEAVPWTLQVCERYLAAAEQRAQDFATKWADEIEKRQAAERRVEALREKARAVLTRRVEYSDAYRAYTRSGLAGSISTDTCRKKLDIARDKLERAEAELAALAQQGETP
jgi:hypothetical protein